MLDISVVLPIHEYNEDVDRLLQNALKSVSEQKKIEDKPMVIFVCPSKIKKSIEDTVVAGAYNIDSKFVINDDNTNFQSQINLGVENVETNYFTILEFDDELNFGFFKNVNRHIKNLPDVGIFLPLQIEVNDAGQALKLTNEIVWSKQIVGENGKLGYLNTNALQQYTDFKISSGAVIKKSEFESIGGLKTKIELTFTYEFLLRALNNGVDIYTIPKLSVRHYATRIGSLFHTYSTTLTLEERKFWFETAKKEANFFTDRVIDLTSLNAQ